MRLKELDMETLEQGNIICRVTGLELLFYVYMGYTDSLLFNISRMKLNISDISLGLERLAKDKLNNIAPTMYLICKIPLNSNIIKGVSLLDSYIEGIVETKDIDIKYLKDKRDTLTRRYLEVDKLVRLLYDEVYKVEGIKDFTEKEIQNWVLKTNLSLKTKIVLYTNKKSQELVKDAISEKYKETEREYNDLKAIIENSQKVTTNFRIGNVYIVNRVSKVRSKYAKKVYMLYLGNDKWVQIGTYKDFRDSKEELLYDIKNNKNNYSIDSILSTHNIVSLDSSTEIYELPCEINLKGSQYLHTRTKIQLKEAKLDTFYKKYIRN